MLRLHEGFNGGKVGILVLGGQRNTVLELLAGLLLSVLSTENVGADMLRVD